MEEDEKKSSRELVIGYSKNDFRMEMRLLHGEEDCQINALMAGADYNMRKILKYSREKSFLCRFSIGFIHSRLFIIALLSMKDGVNCKNRVF